MIKRYSGIFGQLVLLAGLMTQAATDARAEQERGNGGDGVVLDDGTIVLFDLFERSLMQEDRPVGDRVRNFTMDSAARSILYRKLPDFKKHDQKWRTDVERSLGHRLSFMATDYPSVAQTVMDELETLTWTIAPVDLKPNVDTHPFLELGELKRLGCARTVGAHTLYSPSCVSPKMRAAHFAALLVHEALYSYLKKLEPALNDSFPVRTAVAVFHGLKIGYPYTYTADRRKALREAGFGSLVDRDEAIQKVFFGGNRGYSWHAARCTFARGSRIERVDVGFSGAMYLSGDVNVEPGKLGDCKDLVYGYSRESRAAYNRCNLERLDDVKEGWIPGIPKFDLEKKTMTVSIGIADSEERFELTRHLEGPVQATYAHWDNDNWERREGTCDR